MKTNDQNAAIARACGWKFTAPPVGGIQSCDWQAPSGAYRQKCPDYINDLNAMNEAENYFVQFDGCVWGEEWERYVDILSRICTLSEPSNCLMRSTAAQRAEAFLKTLSLWTGNL